MGPCEYRGPCARLSRGLIDRRETGGSRRTFGREHTCTCAHVTPSLQIKNQDFEQVDLGDEDICERQGGRAVEADAPLMLGGVDVDDDVGLPSLLGRTGKGEHLPTAAATAEDVGLQGGSKRGRGGSGTGRLAAEVAGAVGTAGNGQQRGRADEAARIGALLKGKAVTAGLRKPTGAGKAHLLQAMQTPTPLMLKSRGGTAAVVAGAAPREKNDRAKKQKT